ncbi:PepSY-like domain-containing protein [Flavobacterium sp.]|uniref:PepSY-like domain-containing protein n=1 Tax=Flavobacterium sp. TaxID=239 RepID=UPI0039E26CF4
MNTSTIFVCCLLFLGITTVSAQKKITTAELPKGANEFLEQHFKGIAITKAKKDAEHGEKGYEVILADGTEVEFWKDGKYREVDGKGKPIPTAFLDPKIVEYVKKNYSGKEITHIDYGHNDVDVDLTGKIDLEFDKNGNFLKAD